MLAAGPFGLGPMELVIILLVLVMLFGATRLADIGGSLGKGIREFRKEVAADEDEAPVAHAASEAPASNGEAPSNGGGAEVVSAVKCPSCGALNATGAKFCSQCAASLTAPVS
jgi:sec-independent protein translocase protein TatA